MDLNKLRWAAGLIEGEGCFYLHKKSNMPCIIIGMTDYDVIQRLAKFLDVTLIGPIKRTNNRKEFWRINFAGKRAAAWAMTLYPLMGTRRRTTITKMITAWRTIPARKRGPTTGYKEKPNAARSIEA
jgi:hypothetical protein